MKLVAMALAATALTASAQTAVSGFAQLRHVQRLQGGTCQSLEACDTMADEIQGELLLEHRASGSLSGSLRVEALHDSAISESHVRVREGFVDWSPSGELNLKLGRQVLTWGVSDYLYVNDVFPKNYDSFFTGGGFDRMKEPVDAARAAWHVADADLEAVVSRSKADRSPDARRFAAMGMSSPAVEMGDADDQADVALKISSHAGGWDWAGYAASLHSREARYFMDSSGLRFDRPRLQHLGLSLTGNAVGGLVWVEGALRHAEDDRLSVVSRHFVSSTVKLIGGYSREVGSDVTASVQLQVEGVTSRDRYLTSLAQGVRPLDPVSTTLHLRLHGRWNNQTLGAGAQLFAGNEGDSHFNPFVSWSPADGWAIEGGANVFSGRPDTRYGALQDDSNVYVLGRYSF